MTISVPMASERRPTMTSLCHRCVHNSVCEQYNADRDMVRKRGAKNSAPFPSMVVVFRPKMEMLEGLE